AGNGSLGRDVQIAQVDGGVADGARQKDDVGERLRKVSRLINGKGVASLGKPWELKVALAVAGHHNGISETRSCQGDAHRRDTFAGKVVGNLRADRRRELGLSGGDG